MALVVFIAAAVMVLGGALGVILRPNPVHAALSLILTLFGIAVLFVAQDAQFLAVVQVIVYAGAIVVLFLFVIMLLGVDRTDDLSIEPLRVQRPLAVIIGVAVVGLVAAAVLVGAGDNSSAITGQRSSGAALDPSIPNINQLARSLFSDYVFAFEVTSILLIIAVLGTVLLARRPFRAGPARGAQATGDKASEKVGAK